MADVVVFGTGDIARLAHAYFARDSPHRVVAFTVDRGYLSGERFLDLPLVPFDEVARHYPASDCSMFVALSYARMNHVRAEKFEAARQQGYRLVSYVSSRCSYLTDAPVGENCFILEDNTVQPFVRIGHDVTLWSGNHIGHDSVIEDHCFISSHVVVSGHCRIEPYCFVGVNATLHNGVTLAQGTLVGAGAVITEDTVAEGVYVPPCVKLIPKKSSEVDL